MAIRTWFLPMAMLLAAGSVPAARAAENLLANPGFEEALEPGWDKRTPEDATRRIRREENAGRTGAAALLENIEPVYTRLRQGHDRSLAVAPGSLVELSAWIRSEQDADGVAMLQLYCMDEAGGIRAQPVSPTVRGACDWTRQRLLAMVPEHTAYLMVYVQTRGGKGRVWFDDVELVVRREPLPRPPAPRIALLTDLPEDDTTLAEARVLFADGLERIEPPTTALAGDFAGALVLFRDAPPPPLNETLATFARAGGRVFMDLRAFARLHGTEAEAAELGPLKGKSLPEQMATGLRVVKAADATGGFAPGQTMPRASWPEGTLLVLPAAFALPGMEVLGVVADGRAGLVQMQLGEGSIVACDLLSLREPRHNQVDAYYKFTPASGALGNPVRLGRYYPAKLPYDGVVAEMKRLADAFPQTIRLEEEGPASEDYRLWSLNLGRPGAPLYFLYAAAHGSEWEPGYGLMAFAQRLAEGALTDAIDLDKVEIKIIPLLNPWGYERMRRQNAQGVDLNRQGDDLWDTFRGRDSNQDGVWGPGDYDWKGSAPFTEPEARVYQRIVANPNLHCLLDFHGNTAVTSNKLAILPTTAKPENELLALDVQRLANERLRGRHLLRQNEENQVSPYLLDHIRLNQGTPTLLNSGARNRYGMLIELTAGYRDSYGTVLQTDVTAELCRALFLAYPPPER